MSARIRFTHPARHALGAGRHHRATVWDQAAAALSHAAGPERAALEWLFERPYALVLPTIAAFLWWAGAHPADLVVLGAGAVVVVVMALADANRKRALADLPLPADDEELIALIGEAVVGADAPPWPGDDNITVIIPEVSDWDGGPR